MKKSICTSLLLILLALSGNHGFAQANLVGDWDAHCVLERVDEASISYCGLCTSERNEDKKGIRISGVILSFTKKDISITANGVTNSAPYDYDDKLMTLSFSLEEVEYSFSILKTTSDTHPYILQGNEDNGFMLLSRIE